jgi:colanic acid/amylovoran biosynthesis glycosyltransferase
MAADPVVVHLVSPYLFPTGSWVYSQICGLRAYRADVVTSATENLDQFPWDRIEVLPPPTESRLAILRPRTAVRERERKLRLRRALRQASVAHAHFGPEGHHARRAAAAEGVPLVVSFYGYDLTQLPRKYPVWRRRYAALFASAAAVLVEGSHMRATLIGLGCPEEKARLQRLGVDVAAIPFTERRPTGALRILMAASFREKKGLLYGLEAVARSRSAGLESRVTLIGDGPERDGLLNAARELGLTDIVDLQGLISHERLLIEMQEHDVFLQPSVTAADGDSEGGAPVTLIEAAAAGLPVIATWHCDIPEVIVDGKGGLLAPERDVAALADCLLDFAARGDDWPRFGAFNRAHVEANYNLTHQVRLLEEIYDSVRR